MNTPQPLQLTDRDKGPRECPKCGDLRETPWHDQDCSYQPEAEIDESDDDSHSYTSEDIERCYSLADCETDASRNA